MYADPLVVVYVGQGTRLLPVTSWIINTWIMLPSVNLCTKAPSFTVGFFIRGIYIRMLSISWHLDNLSLCVHFQFSKNLICKKTIKKEKKKKKQ